MSLSCFGIALSLVAGITASSIAAPITGKVVAPDGSPAKAADVYYFSYNGQPEANPQPVKTDDAGSFYFENKDARGQLVVLSPSIGAGFAHMDGAQTSEVQIHLRPPTDLTISLVDSDSKPLKDLPVRIRIIRSLENQQIFDGVSLPLTNVPPFAGKTDADGNITFSGLPQATQVNFAVEDDRFAEPGYQDSTITLSKKAQTKADPVQLQPAATISGKILFPTKSPVAGVQVACNDRNDGIWRDTVSNKDGTYKINRLRPGSYNLSLLLEQNDLQKSWAAVAISGVPLLPAEKKENVDFNLISGGILTVTVFAADTEKPIPDVPIGITGPSHPENSGRLLSAQTGKDGALSVHLPPGEQSLYIETNETPGGYKVPDDSSKKVIVEDGKTATVEYRLNKAPPTITINGKVTGPDDAPIVGAAINVFSSADPFPEMQPLLSQPDGSFQIQKVGPTDTIKIRARHDDLATKATTIIKGSNPTSIVLKLEKGILASISGRVLDDKGQPLSGANIQLMERFDRYSTGIANATAGDDGNYTIDSLFPDGNYNLYMDAKGFGRVVPSKFRLKPGQTTTLPDVKLKKRDVPIAGVLLDDDGNPVAGASVTIMSRTSGDNLTTDKDGKFHEDVVAGEQLRIYVLLKDGRRIDKTVKAGDIHIMLDPMVDAKGPAN